MSTAVRIALVGGVFFAALVGSAGRLDLPFVWATVAIEIVFVAVMGIRMDPGLRRERVNPGPGGIDRSLRVILAPVILFHWIIVGLDVGRFHWSRVPPSAQVVSLVTLTLSMAFVSWAVSVNRFFSPVVRIQSERGHHLITSGPYRYIRHPGYAGNLVVALSGGLAPGSWWAMIPIVFLVVMLLRRAIIEDRFLHEHLEGYAEYARNVRYRLLPGVW